MISKKGQARIAIAVSDYKEMFPEEYESLMLVIQDQRDNLETDMAEIKGSSTLKRALYTISEKLSGMIHMKLDDADSKEWTELESQRWFCKTYPEFSVTKHV